MYTTITSNTELTHSPARSTEPMIIPTGGAGSTFPPHSLGAFRSSFGISDAVALNVQGVPRRDKPDSTELVVMDPRAVFLRADINESHPIRVSYESLRSLRRNGELIVPSLDEVLDTYAMRTLQTGKRTELNIRLADDTTVDAVVARLHERIRLGEIAYSDFVVHLSTANPNIEATLGALRAIDPQLRLGLIMHRREDSIAGVISNSALVSKARQLGAESISVDRRDLTPSIAEAIRNAGFTVGCHQAHTTDEIEGALAAGATRVHTGALYGTSRDASPCIRPAGSPLFGDLQRLGFYVLRDSLDEMQKEIAALAERPDTTTRLVLPLGVDAALHSRGRSRALLQSARAGFGQTPATDLATIEVPQEYLGAIERTTTPKTWGGVLSFEGLRNTFRAFATTVATQTLTQPSDEFTELVDALDIISIAELGDSEAVTPLRSAAPYCGAEELRILEETAREVMTRAGRCLGMLATAGLAIERGGKDFYVVEIDSDILELSTAARIAAREQVAATLIERGARGQVRFGAM